MAYHTALALQAGQPFPVEIGGRLVEARPVSVPVMLRVLAAAASRDATTIIAARDALFRAAFPRPRILWWRDPVRLIARLPDALQRAVVERLCRVPHDAPDALDPNDPYAATRAWQRAASRPKAATGPQPTLLLAAQACRAVYGHAWYYAPDCWPTSDGYVPHDVCWVEFAGLAALEARAQLVQVQAAAVTQAGKQARRALDALLRAAYPADPLTAAARGGFVH